MKRPGGGFPWILVILALLAVAFVAHGQLLPRAGASPAAGPAARQAIAYAEAQIGKPYVWAAEGPAEFDCSGLVWAAWRSAGVTIPRTTFDQWKKLPRVARPRPGDLVLFAGGDGTPANPGHVGIVVIARGRHGWMIEAYAPGYPVRRARFGAAGSPGGDRHPVGFVRPAGGGAS
jgi:cell wall-associated NlpC family hydrolase